MDLGPCVDPWSKHERERLSKRQGTISDWGEEERERAEERVEVVLGKR